MTDISKLFYFLSIPNSKGFKPIKILIAESLNDLGVKNDLQSFQTTLHGGIFSESVKRAIKHSDFVIADLTNYDPNVMYEVGYAHALKKPVLLIIQSNFKKVPSNIGGYLFFVYSIPELKDSVTFDILKDEIKKWVTSQFSDQSSLDSDIS